MSYIRVRTRGRDEWFEVRRGGVTATDMYRLMYGGKATWATVKAEKARPPAFRGNAYTAWGIERESVIAKRICGEYPLQHNTDVLQHADDPRWMATPDLLDPAGALVGDIKTAVWKGRPWDSVPPNYFTQLQWQMFVTGIREAILAVEWHDDFMPVSNDLSIYSVEYDEEHVGECVEVAEAFLTMGQPSLLDTYLADYAAVVSQEQAVKESKDAVRKLIEKEIGDRESFKHVSDAGSVTKSVGKPRQVFDTDRFKAEHPDLWERYTLTKPGSGRLTITPAKETA
ncbi:YqaJ viral recombinase family protein [Brevibacterium otitidis]|uniref:YqaJ viral recombinase family protein n=1 Tax=Brevibacterium otitidis TaxID=53364 RepID=A0ABV5X2J8_9MICO|nr:hypothetical protein GCM10023233_04460 [Brevibacterium otitidis]